MDEAKTFSPLKLALGAVAIAIGLNFVLRVLFKLEGVSITFLIAGSVIGFALLWMVKVVRRAPTKKERSHFLLLYSGILAAACVCVAVVAAINGSLNAGGLVILFVHYLPYPFLALMFFSDKQFEGFFRK